MCLDSTYGLRTWNPSQRQPQRMPRRKKQLRLTLLMEKWKMSGIRMCSGSVDFSGCTTLLKHQLKPRPGTVYFGSVENLVPDKTDEEPSFKVKKEVGPNEPLDVFYFCKDPSLPRFPSGNNILEVDFTVIRAKPVDPSGPSESDNETPHHLIHEKVPINNSDPTGNVFRFYIWPSDVEPKTTSEDAAKEETIETDPTDGKMEDERNSNVFRFCRFFGVHNVVEAPTKLRPGTVYFGSVENLVPDKTDEEPSFKVKKEVGPNEPLDVFYFCKDPSLPRFPSGNNILEVDFTVIRAKPVDPSGPSESDNETPHHLIHEKVPINNSDPTGNVFRFYIWPSDVEPKTTSEDAAKEETIETDPTDGKMEDERNSNVFRFCRFFGVHNVVEAPTKLRPGTVYFGSVENLVPDKTDEEPSFKVKKEVGPNEPLDVFYFCKDPSLPRFPSGNNILEVDFTVIRAKPVDPSGPSESDNETPHHLIPEKVPINNSDPTGNVFRFYICPSEVEFQTSLKPGDLLAASSEFFSVPCPELCSGPELLDQSSEVSKVVEPETSICKVKNDPKLFSTDLEDLVVTSLVADTESGYEEGINYEMIRQLEPWETYYAKKDHEVVSEEVKIYTPREKFEVETVQPINFLSIRKDIEESMKNDTFETSSKDQVPEKCVNGDNDSSPATKPVAITTSPQYPANVFSYHYASPRENEVVKKCDPRATWDEDSFRTVSEDDSANLPLLQPQDRSNIFSFYQKSPAKDNTPVQESTLAEEDITSSASSIGPDGVSDSVVSYPEPKFHSTLENALMGVEKSTDNITDSKSDSSTRNIVEEENIPVMRNRDVFLEMLPHEPEDVFGGKPIGYVSLPIELEISETPKCQPASVVIDIIEDPKHTVSLRSESHSWKSTGLQDRFSDPTLDEDDHSLMSQPTDTILSDSISLKQVPRKTSHGARHVMIPMGTVNEPQNSNGFGVTANPTMPKSYLLPQELPTVSKIHHQSTPKTKPASSFVVTFSEDDGAESDSVASSDIFGCERPDLIHVSDFEVEIFCYTAVGETSMIDIPSLEVLSFLSAIKVEPIVHSVHS